jgi:hypothetical protein
MYFEPGGVVIWNDLTKPFPSAREAILKQRRVYRSSSGAGGSHHAIHSGTALGPFTQQVFGRLAEGKASVTLIVAFLVCCSAALFSLTHSARMPG